MIVHLTQCLLRYALASRVRDPLSFFCLSWFHLLWHRNWWHKQSNDSITLCYGGGGGLGREGGGVILNGIQKDVICFLYSMWNQASFNCIWVHPVRVRLKKTPRSTSNNNNNNNNNHNHNHNNYNNSKNDTHTFFLLFCFFWSLYEKLKRWRRRKSGVGWWWWGGGGWIRENVLHHCGCGSMAAVTETGNDVLIYCSDSEVMVIKCNRLLFISLTSSYYYYYYYY